MRKGRLASVFDTDQLENELVLSPSCRIMQQHATSNLGKVERSPKIAQDTYSSLTRGWSNETLRTVHLYSLCILL